MGSGVTCMSKNYPSWSYLYKEIKYKLIMVMIKKWAKDNEKASAIFWTLNEHEFWGNYIQVCLCFLEEERELNWYSTHEPMQVLVTLIHSTCMCNMEGQAKLHCNWEYSNES